MLEVNYLTAPIKGDSDGIEADPAVADCVAVFGHPGGGEAPHPQLLAPVDAEHGPLGPVGRAGPPCLDLDEDQGGAVQGDDVELAVAGPGIALDDLPAGGDQLGGDQ